MFGPNTYTEAEALAGYLAEQITAIRTSAHGLTDAQARETPCRSTLSIGGLVKHATYVMTDRDRQRRNPTAMPDQAGAQLFMSSFALTADETLAGALEAFDAAAEAYLEDVRSVDPGGPWTCPPAPWDGRLEAVASVERFALMHHVEEFARHAGHADIIREQLDGASAASLQMAVEGRPGNDFIQPWSPATSAR